MLSNLVSIADGLMAGALFGFATMFWQSPLASMVVVLSMLGLAAMLSLEMSRPRAPKARILQVAQRPIRLRG